MSDNNIITGQTAVTTAGTAELLVAMGERACMITIKAFSTNTGNIYIGPSTVDSATGFILAAGEEVTIVVEAGHTDIYIDSDVSYEGVSYIYWRSE